MFLDFHGGWIISLGLFGGHVGIDGRGDRMLVLRWTILLTGGHFLTLFGVVIGVRLFGVDGHVRSVFAVGRGRVGGGFGARAQRPPGASAAASGAADHVVGQLAVETTLVELVELYALKQVEKLGLALVEAVGHSRGRGIGLRHDRHVVDAAAEVVWDHKASLHTAFPGQE